MRGRMLDPVTRSGNGGGQHDAGETDQADAGSHPAAIVVSSLGRRRQSYITPKRNGGP